MLHPSGSRVARGAGEFEHQASLGQTVTTVDAQLLNAVVMVLTLGVVAGLAVLLVTRGVSLRRSVSIKDSGPLSETEKRGLERVMNLGENRIEMRIPRSTWFPRDLCFPHSQAVSNRVHNSL
jgi:hypothetical protein